MQPLRLFDVIKQVITSWQVIVITIAILVFLNIVFYVSRSYHRPKSIREKKVKVKKSKTDQPTEEVVESSDNDDLGLEEAD